MGLRWHNRKACCLTISDAVTMQCFNCLSLGTMATVPAADLVWVFVCCKHLIYSRSDCLRKHFASHAKHGPTEII